MSEKLLHHGSHEVSRSAEIHEDGRLETAGERHENKTPEIDDKTVEKLKDKIEQIPQASSSSVKAAIDESTKNVSAPKHPPNKALRKVALNSSLIKIRSHLGKSENTLSKFIHRPSINAVSEITGKTLIRPSGFFMGGLTTLVGSLYYFYASHQTGYKYNFLVGLLLFVGGFVTGLVIELVYDMLRQLFKSGT
ncbi:MAG TPA: YrhK family protein [Candidatus Saccharimonadales bacterium]|nr:YrhK family protein [Candidatus Saccharimonadales bacterium]